jgi:hypothetical protein
MHPTLTAMLATQEVADLHRDAAPARVVHGLHKEHPTTRRAGRTRGTWRGRDRSRRRLPDPDRQPHPARSST